MCMYSVSSDFDWLANLGSRLLNVPRVLHSSAIIKYYSMKVVATNIH